MCLLITKPRGIHIPDDYLYSGYEINSHGAGFAIAKDNKVQIHKGFFTFESFLKAYKKMTEDQELPALIHFRLATSGYKDKDNCHPFQVGPYAMGHNGIINSLSDSYIKSDTRLLADKLHYAIKDVPDLLDDPTFLENLEEFIGYNKIAFLRPDGDFIILHEKAGSWDGGVWYSNGGYKNRRMPGNYTEESSCSLPVTRNKSHFCKGSGCFKLLRSQTDIETGYCVHCATNHLVVTVQEDEAWYENRVSFWENRTKKCTVENCDGTCTNCQEHFNGIIMEEASKDNFTIDYENI